MKRVAKLTVILVGILLLLATPRLSTLALEETNDSKTTQPYTNAFAPNLPVVNVTLYEGEINATTYGFGNTSSSLTSPGPTLHFQVSDIVNVTVYNVGILPHAWALTDAPQTNANVLFNAEIGSAESPLAPGTNGSVAFQVTQAGDFFYICPVPGHAELGMWGNVTITFPSRVPGVSAGQFLGYSFNLTVAGNDTDLLTRLTPQTAWSNVTVLNVTDTIIVFQQDFYNGTSSESEMIAQDVLTGSQNASTEGFPLGFLPANLSQGDLTFIVPPFTFYVNGTVQAYYLGEQIEADFLTLAGNASNTYQYGILVNTTVLGQTYWERKTGIMLELNLNQTTSRPDGAGGLLTSESTGRVLIVAAEPQLPVIPEFDSPLILLLLMTTVLLAATSFRKRRRTHTTALPHVDSAAITSDLGLLR